MKIIFNIVFLLLSFNALSQSLIIGKLTGQKDNPIVFANIIIDNTQLGTISNKDGIFEIRIPEKCNSSALIISSIGYKTKKLNVKYLQTSKLQTIILEKDIVNLNEITIKINPTNSREIVEKAFDHYLDNFPTTPFIGKAFLRHTEKTKTKYKWLVDAAIEVYDPGFNQSSKDINLNIEEIKRSIDNRSVDTARIYGFYLKNKKNTSSKESLKRRYNLANEDPKEIQKSINFKDNQLSTPLGLFSGGLNVIRYYKQKDAIFDKNIIKKHNFKIDTVLAYNADDIYKIKITPKSPLVKLNKRFGKYLFPIGWIYIRAKDYAIIELEYTLVRSKKGQIHTRLYGSKIASSFHIKFIEINGKMYPKHITLNMPKANKLRKIINNTSNNTKVIPEDYYYETQEIIFNEIVTDKAVITKSIEKPWNSNLFTPRSYNAEFWEKYSSMVETKEQKIFRENLEAELSKKQN